MFLEEAAAYLPYAFITAFTPGPNTMLSFYSISTMGVRRGSRVIAAMSLAFLAVMLICAAVCHEASLIPGVLPVLTMLGALYMLWLAFCLARSRPEQARTQGTTPAQGAMLQFVNAKIYLYAVTVYSAYVLPASNDAGTLVPPALLLTAIGAAGMAAWGLAGALLQRFLERWHRPSSLVMALILAYCALDLLR